MTLQEKADMIYSQNQEMMKELGVSKEAFRVCFEKGYNFEQDEKEARQEICGYDEEAAFKEIWEHLAGDKNEKCLFIISQDRNGKNWCFFQGSMRIGSYALAASCALHEDIRTMLCSSIIKSFGLKNN